MDVNQPVTKAPKDFAERIRKCEFVANVVLKANPAALSVLLDKNKFSLYDLLITGDLSPATNPLPTTQDLSIEQIRQCLKNLDGNLPIYLNEISIRQIQENTFPVPVALSLVGPGLGIAQRSCLLDTKDATTSFLIDPKNPFQRSGYIQGVAQCKSKDDLFLGFVSSSSSTTVKRTKSRKDKFATSNLTPHDYDERVISLLFNTPHNIYIEEDDIAPFVLNSKKDYIVPLVQFDKTQSHAIIGNIVKELVLMAECLQKDISDVKTFTATTWWPVQLACNVITETETTITIPQTLLDKVVWNLWRKIAERNKKSVTNTKNVIFSIFNADKVQLPTIKMPQIWKDVSYLPDTQTEDSECKFKLRVAFYVDIIHLNKDAVDPTQLYYPRVPFIV